jgi:hypothetical protein
MFGESVHWKMTHGESNIKITAIGNLFVSLRYWRGKTEYFIWAALSANNTYPGTFKRSLWLAQLKTITQ